MFISQVLSPRPDTSIDGVTHWESMRNSLPSSRTEFIYNLDDFEPATAGDYKLLMGYPGAPGGWYKPNMNRTRGDVFENLIYLKGYSPVHLYNIRKDPTEHNDLAAMMPDMVDKLRTRIDYDRKQMVPALFPPPDPASFPKHLGNVWSPGWC